MAALSSVQKRVIIEFVLKNSYLLNSSVSIKNTEESETNKWKDLSCKLNDMEGPKKEWTRWIKCWKDIRYRWKLKKSENNPNDWTLTESDLIEMLNELDGNKKTINEKNDTVIKNRNSTNIDNEESIEKISADLDRLLDKKLNEGRSKTSIIPSKKNDQTNGSLFSRKKFCNRLTTSSKRRYYNQKLALMRQDIRIKKEILGVLKTISEKLP